ncbi:MAG: hypothetical protein H6Q72_4346 [Firmicutes bacterium]|nr:hypothetical protein [Bacillota bacterium]
MGRGFRINFSVPELKTAMANISAYDGRTAGKIEDAVKKATVNVSKGARQRVAVDTGDLKKNIRSRFDKKTVTGYIIAKTWYAHFVEGGAKACPSRNIPARAPKPFMKPAIDKAKPELIRDIEQAVKKT